jgi:hypothetical protein
VAVKVTPCFVLDGFALDVTTTEELPFTVKLMAGEVAGGKVPFPLYCAVREYVPAASVIPGKVAVPEKTWVLPSAVLPLKKVTPPGAMDGVRVAVSVTG